MDQIAYKSMMEEMYKMVSNPDNLDENKMIEEEENAEDVKKRLDKQVENRIMKTPSEETQPDREDFLDVDSHNPNDDAKNNDKPVDCDKIEDLRA
jgi:hypothetical protein